VPAMEVPLWLGKQHPYCVVIPVINEGERIKSLLKRMEANQIPAIADIIIVDGGSTDDSLELNALRKVRVRGLVLKKGPGKLSAQLRCAYAFALDQGYEGIVTIDGNDKDDPEAIPRFIDALKEGSDFVQASRFKPGGASENTPKLREFAIKYIHAPMLRLASGFKWTDTTQGFRGYSRRILLDPRVAPFRNIFSSYELLAYLSYRIPKLQYRCEELPTKRAYPVGDAPTKITKFKGNFSVIMALINSCLGFFNPNRIENKAMAGSIFLVLMAAIFSWHVIKISFSEGSSEYPSYGKQPDSIYSYLQELNPVVAKLPRSGIICYIGTAQAGESPRKYYLWTLYALAPRILIPWGKRVLEEGVGLRTVAPSLLWTGAFNENTCSYVLLHRIDKQGSPFVNPKYIHTEEIISGGISMSLYKRVD